jgi:2-C-methyl-D-erythritol 4-phosphate cytidylyltransferase
VAGGEGRRFGEPKQFVRLAGRAVVEWSVEAAGRVADGVVLVVPEASVGDRATVDADRVVAGGASRSASVRAGLAAVPAEAAVILVHDAVRPLATPALFSVVLDALADGDVDGIVPAVPVSDTLKRVAEGEIVATLDRGDLVAVQTPQAFAAAILRKAHAAGGEATDDAGLVEAVGGRIRAVAGEPNNIKLTRPEDLVVAEALATGVLPGQEPKREPER